MMLKKNPGLGLSVDNDEEEEETRTKCNKDTGEKKRPNNRLTAPTNELYKTAIDFLLYRHACLGNKW